MASSYHVEELSQEQVQAFRNAFDRFDENGDGTITKAELNVVMHSLGHTPTDNELYEILTESGNEGYERIDFTEFLLMMAKRLKSGSTEEELMTAFRALDDDGNGHITVQELRQALIKVGTHLSEREVVDMIKEADFDGDGMVNYEEDCRVIAQETIGGEKFMCKSDPATRTTETHLESII